MLRSNEMDSAFENDPDTAPGLIQHTFQRIRAALQKLAALKFHHAVIATDHGFYMNTAGVGSGAAGSVCSKPPGTWLTVHDRLLLGDGSGDPANFVLPADRLAIRGDFGQAAGPRTLSAYKAGQGYFHGGLSLPETVLPVLSVALRTAAAPAAQRPKVTLDYKQGARRVTTRLPVVEVAVESNLFTGDASVEILLEAHDKTAMSSAGPRAAAWSTPPPARFPSVPARPSNHAQAGPRLRRQVHAQGARPCDADPVQQARPGDRLYRLMHLYPGGSENLP